MSEQAEDADTKSPTRNQIRTTVATISAETDELQRLLEDRDNPALERNAAQLNRIVEVLEMNIPPGLTDEDET